MFEKVNPAHPDKIADRIAGALVDLGYQKNKDCRMAVEVLLGHGECYITGEVSEKFSLKEVKDIVNRIAGYLPTLYINLVPQDVHLADNQKDIIKCGDNGIFKGMPVTNEQKKLVNMAHNIYNEYPFDGKYIISHDYVTICQSNVLTSELKSKYPKYLINPLGEWTGGIDVDSGAANRKLGSDMGDSITGGGLHGKDLSKADVSVNIVAWLLAQYFVAPIEASCSIGDTKIVFHVLRGVENKIVLPYHQVVGYAKDYIEKQGGFEKFAEWGLV